MDIEGVNMVFVLRMQENLQFNVSVKNCHSTQDCVGQQLPGVKIR